MGGFTFVLLMFVMFVLIMGTIILNTKGRMSVYLTAITTTLSAWFIGLVIDSNIDFGEPKGFLSLRILLPILTMGICILNAITKNKSDK